MQTNFRYVALIIILVLLAAGAFVFFRKPETPQNTQNHGEVVRLYYYNESKDKDTSGNIMCSKAGLDPIERRIQATESLAKIEETVKLLLAGGNITQSDIDGGISTEYPLPGVELTDIKLDDGTLILTFADPEHWTGGGSCRVTVLRMQIEETAKQFPGIQEVKFEPEELFQP